MNCPNQDAKPLPPHWECKKLKYLASLKSGETITSDSISDNGDYPVYGGNGLRGFTSNFTHSGDYVLIGRQGALCGNINYDVFLAIVALQRLGDGILAALDPRMT